MAARADAEAPQLLRRLLVMVDEIVELERVDLTGVVPSQPVAHALDQPLKLGFVVPADGRAGSAPARLRRLRGDAGSDRPAAPGIACAHSPSRYPAGFVTASAAA